MDLSAHGFSPPSIEASVADRAFVFDLIIKGGKRCIWRYVVDEPVYTYVPDGSDPEAHSIWARNAAGRGEHDDGPPPVAALADTWVP